MFASTPNFTDQGFDEPSLSFDAIMDREEGKHPFGMRQAVLEDMFTAFATRTVELFVRVAQALGFKG